MCRPRFGALAVLVALFGGAATMASAGWQGTVTAGGTISSARLAPPTSLSATGTASVALTWTPSSVFASGTRVFRATVSGGPYTQVAQLDGTNQVTYTDNPGPGTFSYVVQAYYREWTSVFSNEVTALVEANLLVRTANNWVSDATAVTATFAATPATGHLLVGVAAARGGGAIGVPAGWTMAVQTQATQQPRQMIFYKVAQSEEPKNVTVTTTTGVTALGLHLYEYNGLSLPVAAAQTASGAGVAPATPSVLTTVPTLVFVAMVSAPGSNNGYGTWTAGFAERSDFGTGTGNPDQRVRYAAADAVQTLGSIQAGATISISSDWTAQIAAFPVL